ncbi:hypothetical protein KC640_00860 [Candidatus Dojkabacteria bacterium]|uniref:Uncharacterized protein n=1 Tax=Candidatus Dojkabacteria bacterium TaxID=2099670 RepID=A0A955I6Z9_9BACT|nr:hypothetical protein [Candidatus Dojkabacteria bacterium]
MATLPLLPYYYLKRRREAKRRKAEAAAKLKAEQKKDSELLAERRQQIETFGEIGAGASGDLLEIIPGQDFYPDLQAAFADFVAVNPSHGAMLDFDKLNLAMLFVKSLPAKHSALEESLQQATLESGKSRAEVNRAVAELLRQNL